MNLNYFVLLKTADDLAMAGHLLVAGFDIL